MNRALIYYWLGLLWLGLPTTMVSAAELFFEPKQADWMVGSTQQIELRLDGQGEVINAVTGQLNYSPEQVELIEVSRAGSFLTLWPVEPQVDVTRGIISFAGGIPYGSYVVTGRVLTLVVQVKKPGQLELNIVPNATQVFLNDGLGTPAALSLIDASYAITPGAIVTPSTDQSESNFALMLVVFLLVLLAMFALWRMAQAALHNKY